MTPCPAFSRHKTANVLNKLPKHKQPAAKSDLQDIWMAETRKDAITAYDLFVEKYDAKYARAVACLQKDRDEAARPSPYVDPTYNAHAVVRHAASLTALPIPFCCRPYAVRLIPACAYSREQRRDLWQW